MNQRKFGRTGLPVSELCLGAMQFGWRVNEANAFAILDAYHEVGGNFIQTTTCDTAGGGSQLDLGRSEEIVGAWLHANPGARSRVLLSTRMQFSRNHTVPGYRATVAETVRRQCEESLRRLRTTHLDLLVCEWSDSAQPMDDIFTAFNDLLRAGKLRYVGAAGFPVWRFMESIGRSARHGGCRFESFQADYSLLERAPFEPDAMDLAREYRVALLAESPLAGGFLTGLYHQPQPETTARMRWLRERYGHARGLAVLAALAEVAKELRATSAQVALAWVLSHPVIMAPVLGFFSPEHVREAAAATRMTLTENQIVRLEQAATNSPIVHPSPTSNESTAVRS